ncbi:MAG: phosphatidylglycerophosphatase A family protein [Acidobacteriaceae bacterium]
MNGQRTRWAWTLGTFFGTGYLRPGPGTWGSAAGLLLWLAVARWAHPSPLHLAVGTAAAALAIVLAGVPACNIIVREGGVEDPGFVVLDEVAGQWIALIGATTSPWLWLSAFLLFRVFDILKPPPARQFDRMQGGFGIMMDDVAAGLYALVLVWIGSRLLAGHPL